MALLVYLGYKSNVFPSNILGTLLLIVGPYRALEKTLNLKP